MKQKIPMVLLLLTPYLLLLTVILSAGENIDRVPAAWGAACLLVFLPNMVYAFVLPRMGYKAEQMLFWSMVFKLCNIPLYGFVFLVGLLMNVFVIPLLPFLILFDYSVLLPSSLYAVSGLVQARKDRRISAAALVLHGAMQFVFCLDVCSAVYLYLSLRER